MQSVSRITSLGIVGFMPTTYFGRVSLAYSISRARCTLHVQHCTEQIVALGQKQTYAAQYGASALPPKADMCGAATDVRFGSIADIPAHSIIRAAIALLTT
jgi:hypothetical protein